ncbi:MAG: hypothetical protein PHU85_01340 [Phycisphaerae bacterium]|nr:hypothetical protein [Phycisphaerae bacterium]
MRMLIGTLIGLAVMAVAITESRADAAPAGPAGPAASQPADSNAAFDADLNKYIHVPQRSFDTATAHCYSDTVLPRVIDKLNLDAATKTKVLAAYEAWRAKVNPKYELRYKKLTALRNWVATEKDAAKKADYQAQINSLRWPTQGEALAVVMKELKGILTDEQLAKLEAAARECVLAGIDQFMQHLVGLYPDLTVEQMKQVNELIKSTKGEAAKLLPGDVTGMGPIQAKFQQTFRNTVLTEEQRKRQVIRE